MPNDTTEYEARLKIIMISSEFMPEVFGGAEQQCFKLSKKLVALGHEVTILTSRKSDKVAECETTDGVSIIRILCWGPPQLLTFKYLFSSVIWFFKVLAWLKTNKNNYDIIHMHQVKFNAFVGLYAAKKLNKRSIIKTGNSGSGFDLDSVKRKPLFGRFLYNYIVKNADVAIAISNHIKKELEAAGIPKTQIVFIPNGVDILVSEPLSTAKKNVVRKQLDLPCNKKIFLFVGRLEKQKDVLLLINSFAVSSPQENNLLLVLVGDGNLRSTLQSLTKEKSISNDVVFAGYRKDVNSFIMAADFFVLSTRTEGLSNALLEAMSTGLVPISTAVSGSVDLIADGVNGYLTELGSEASLTSNIIKASKLSEEELNRFKVASFLKVQQNYEMEHIANEYITLYKRLIS